MRTLKDCKGTCNLQEFAIPAGTEVGFTGKGYVVLDENETARIIRNTYTARHHFLWLEKGAEVS